jgi:hypothetical protein
MDGLQELGHLVLVIGQVYKRESLVALSAIVSLREREHGLEERRFAGEHARVDAVKEDACAEDDRPVLVPKLLAPL